MNKGIGMNKTVFKFDMSFILRAFLILVILSSIVPGMATTEDSLINEDYISLGRVSLGSNISLNNNQGYSLVLATRDNINLEFANLIKSKLRFCISNYLQDSYEVVNHEVSEEVNVISFTSDNEQHCFIKEESSLKILSVPIRIESTSSNLFLDLEVLSESNTASSLIITHDQALDSTEIVGENQIDDNVVIEGPSEIPLSNFELNYELKFQEDGSSLVKFIITQPSPGLITIFTGDGNQLIHEIASDEIPFLVSYVYPFPGQYFVSATLSKDNKVIGQSEIVSIEIEKQKLSDNSDHTTHQDPEIPETNPIFTDEDSSQNNDPANLPEGDTTTENSSGNSSDPLMDLIKEEAKKAKHCDPKKLILEALNNEQSYMKVSTNTFLSTFINKFIPALRADTKSSSTLQYNIDDTRKILRDYTKAQGLISKNPKLLKQALSKLTKAYTCTDDYKIDGKPSPRIPIIKKDIQEAIKKDNESIALIKEFVSSLHDIEIKIISILKTPDLKKQVLEINLQILIGSGKGSIPYSIKLFAKLIKAIEEANLHKFNAYLSADGSEFDLPILSTFSNGLSKLSHSMSNFGTENAPNIESITSCDPKPDIKAAHVGILNDQTSNSEIAAAKHLRELMGVLAEIASKLKEIYFLDDKPLVISKEKSGKITDELFDLALKVDANYDLLKDSQRSLYLAYKCAEQKGSDATVDEINKAYAKDDLAQNFFGEEIGSELNALLISITDLMSITPADNFASRSRAFKPVEHTLSLINLFDAMMSQYLEPALVHKRKAYALELGDPNDLPNYPSLDTSKKKVETIIDEIYAGIQAKAKANEANEEKSPIARKEINYKNKCDPREFIAKSHKVEPPNRLRTNNDYNLMLFLEDSVKEFNAIILELNTTISSLDANKPNNLKHAGIAKVQDKTTLLIGKLKKGESHLLTTTRRRARRAIRCIERDHKGKKVAELKLAQNHDLQVKEQFNELLESMQKFNKYLDEIRDYDHISKVNEFQKRFLEEILVFTAIDKDFSFMIDDLKAATSNKKFVYTVYQGKEPDSRFDIPAGLEQNSLVLASTYSSIKAKNEKIIEQLKKEGKL